jgi:hypothetical protein
MRTGDGYEVGRQGGPCQLEPASGPRILCSAERELPLSHACQPSAAPATRPRLPHGRQHQTFFLGSNNHRSWYEGG